ncbi:MAG TPA: alanine racemase [Acidimicrobiales bacterium]
MDGPRTHPTVALVHLDRLAHNIALLRDAADGRPLWPAVKADAYGHGAVLVAKELTRLGCDTLCVAHVSEAAQLAEAGVHTTMLVMAAALPAVAPEMVALGVEPCVCTVEMVDALSTAAVAQGREVAVHVKVDTGMGRVGIRPADSEAFLDYCEARPGIRVRGVMSHFPRADEADKAFSRSQVEVFAALRSRLGQRAEVWHLANSAGVLDVPGSLFDACRPGIAVFGLPPSRTMTSPLVGELQPVLEWRSHITFLKEVPAGTGLSYGHRFVTARDSLVATIPVGYGDGLSRRLTNAMAVLVGGVRCPQVGTITMDQTLVDVTALADRVALGDAVTLVGRQGQEELTVAEIAERLGTITYEVTTTISARVPRIAAL